MEDVSTRPVNSGREHVSGIPKSSASEAHSPEWDNDLEKQPHNEYALERPHNVDFSKGDEVFLYTEGHKVAKAKVYCVKPHKEIYIGTPLGDRRIAVKLTKVFDKTVKLPYATSSASTVEEALMNSQPVMWNKICVFVHDSGPNSPQGTNTTASSREEENDTEEEENGSEQGDDNDRDSNYDSEEEEESTKDDNEGNQDDIEDRDGQFHKLQHMP